MDVIHKQCDCSQCRHERAVRFYRFMGAYLVALFLTGILLILFS